MAEYSREIEVNRLMNVAKAFGWEKIKEEVIGNKLQVTLEKEIKVAAPSAEMPT